jgi:hypothetical protein
MLATRPKQRSPVRVRSGLFPDARRSRKIRSRIAADGARAPAWLMRLGLGLLIIAATAGPSRCGVLSESDLKRVEAIKPQFQTLMMDLNQAVRRPEISSGDSDCIKSTIHELLEISGELSSYEYLITIEKEITDVGDDSPVRGVIKFAVEKSNNVLSTERTRLVDLAGQCRRFPLSYGKTQEALQFIDATSGVLNSIQLQP